ncbi:hypothetical protein [Paraburkholderia sp. SIMBA_054]|uniref:hypothetical protein n=1 Tax=Paraburkholderia sp. SIMBA_054 TaxID=3085795 RepID=UPI00397CBCC7
MKMQAAEFLIAPVTDEKEGVILALLREAGYLNGQGKSAEVGERISNVICLLEARDGQTPEQTEAASGMSDQDVVAGAERMARIYLKSRGYSFTGELVRNNRSPRGEQAWSVITRMLEEYNGTDLVSAVDEVDGGASSPDIAQADDGGTPAVSVHEWVTQEAGNWTVRRGDVMYSVFPCEDGLWQAWGFHFGGRRLGKPQSFERAKALCERHRW